MLHQAFNFQNSVYNTVFPNIIYPIAGISMTGKKTDSIDNSDGSGYPIYRELKDHKYSDLRSDQDHLASQFQKVI